MTQFEMRDRAGNQDIGELTQFLTFVRDRGIRRYLEIGCRNGDTFFAVMKVIGKGGFGLAIDKPENANTRSNLGGTVYGLNSEGIAAKAHFGDSKARDAIAIAKEEGPFDLILIDGDHTLAGVTADWNNYAGMGKIIALHDVTAPDGHNSDGRINGVGTFWRNLDAPGERLEFATPGSMMGFGIAIKPEPVKAPAAAKGDDPGPLVIGIPAWTPPYVDLAVKYTIPATLASLAESPFRDVTLLMHTDDAFRMREAVGDAAKVDIRRVPPSNGRDSHWHSFKQAHKDAIEATPKRGFVALLNSDIVVSRETFSEVAKSFANEKIKTIVSVGIRTAIDHAAPPIGVSADELFKWIWANPHHITQECTWGSGRTQHPTILFFEHEDGVSMHCFHLTPMFLRKDRNLNFKGTIDDDLLGNYRDEEIHFMRDGAAAFAELSPDWKKHPFGDPLTVDRVLNFGSRRFSKAHVRNFAQRMRVLGNPVKNHPAADEILARILK
jgi:hypothetical protein